MNNSRHPLWAGALVAAVAILVAGVVGGVAAGSSGHIGCPGKNIHFKAADGTGLVAHRYGTGKTFVVLAHQADGNLCQWYPYAKRLASLRYTALPFDFRNAGESQPRTGPAQQRVERDVAAAIKLARTLGANKVFVLGASMGGWAALVGSAMTNPPVQGVVSLSTPAQLEGDAVAAVRKLTAPTLYLVSQDEGLTQDAQTLYDATAATDKTLKIVPGSAHGIDLLDPLLGRPSYKTVRGQIEAFLKRH